MLLVLEAAFWLVAARVAILFIPFPWLVRYLGRLCPPRETGSGSGEHSPQRAQQIARAIVRAAQALPFEAVCLPRALAARQMLHRHRIPVKIHFGALRRPGASKLLTHAWVDACGVEVSGYPQAHECAEIGFIAS